MVHGGGYHTSAAWYRLTPDASGSYVNGTWTTLPPMHTARLDFPTALLPDGRVLVMGGYSPGRTTGPRKTTRGRSTTR
jgi:hypothetical protein